MSLLLKKKKVYTHTHILSYLHNNVSLSVQSCKILIHLEVEDHKFDLNYDTYLISHVDYHQLYHKKIMHGRTLKHLPQDAWPRGPTGPQKAVHPNFRRHSKGLLASQVAQ